MNTLSSNSYSQTIRHTHRSAWSMGAGLNMVTERTGESERTNLRFDVYDSAEPTAILMLTYVSGDKASHADMVLNHEQIEALVRAGQAFLKQYPHGVESRRRREQAES